MSDPFLGEIRMFAGNFAPAGWHFCDGALLSIAENDALYTLLGTTYGGDGNVTFGLPDLRGRLPLHVGSSFVLGQPGGTETVTLTVGEMPTHTHPMMASSDNASLNTPQNNVLANTTALDLYRVGLANSPMDSQAVSSVVGSQPHTNFQPYLCVNFIIALQGIYPPQS